ncbi:MAG: LytTR family DNA-binding domain-containing protein [Chitinophagaceae bacterium]
MLRAIAIDDEPLALEVIKKLSEKVVFMELAGCFVNAFEAMDFLQKEKIDLIFLDIKMPTISGIEFIRSVPNPPMVIFTTAYSEYAVQSFELDAIDYLLKPFSLPRFLKACNKAHDLLKMKNGVVSEEPRSVFIKSGYEKVSINLDDIQYVESVGNYVQFIVKDKKIVSRLTMNEAQELLPAADFIRIHRSYIISRKNIAKADKRSVWIKDVELPIGQAYSKEVEKIIK